MSIGPMSPSFSSDSRWPMSPRWMVWTPSTSITNETCLPASAPRASSRYVRTPVTRTSLTSYSPGPSSTKASSRLDGRSVRPSRECLPFARGSGRSSGWLKTTMSPLIPRPVGPTTDWNGSATTTASLPRNRTHVRPYQVSSIPPILTHRPASPLHPRSERRPGVEARRGRAASERTSRCVSDRGPPTRHRRSRAPPS